MIIDCISDLHGEFPVLEGGDLLIVAGDLTASDTEKQHVKFQNWVMSLDYKKIIYIAGNHDNRLRNDPPFANEKWEYLCDSGTEIVHYPKLNKDKIGETIERQKFKVWGIPWSRSFIGMNPHCKAFTYDDENWFYDEKVSKIPNDVDILITHAPPYGILDTVKKYSYGNPRDFDIISLGSIAIYNWLKYVGRPKLHVFGHIHEGYGQVEVFPTYNDKMMISVNASIMNGDYDPVNKPIRVIL